MNQESAPGISAKDAQKEAKRKKKSKKRNLYRKRRAVRKKLATAKSEANDEYIKAVLAGASDVDEKRSALFKATRAEQKAQP